MCLLFLIAACGSDDPAESSTTTESAAPAEQASQSQSSTSNSSSSSKETLAPIKQASAPFKDSQDALKHYVLALDAARMEDWATVEKELKQVTTQTSDSGHAAVVDVLLGKLKAKDYAEVTIHLMKLLSLTPEQSPEYVWYLEIYRHAKSEEWPQLEAELHETIKVAPRDTHAQLQQFVDQLKAGDTATLAEEIRQYTGIVEQ